MDRLNVTDRDELALATSKQSPSGIGQADLVTLEPFFGTLKKDRGDFAAVRPKENLRSRPKSFGATQSTIAPHDDHRLPLRVQADAARSQPPTGSKRRFGASVTYCNLHSSMISC